MILKALHSSYKVVHVAQLLKLQVAQLITSYSSFSFILVTRKEFAKTMANLINFFLGVQHRDFGRLNITK